MTKRKYIKPPRSEDCEWRSGPPPEIGWWPADYRALGKDFPRHADVLRYYDGSGWSRAAFAEVHAMLAARTRTRPALWGDILWSARWWLDENGRHKGAIE